MILVPVATLPPGIFVMAMITLRRRRRPLVAILGGHSRPRGSSVIIQLDLLPCVQLVITMITV